MLEYVKRVRFYHAKDSTAKEDGASFSPGAGYSDAELENVDISAALTENMNAINKIMENDTDLIIRNIVLGRKKQKNAKLAAIIYINSLIDNNRIDNDMIRPLIIDVYKSGFESADEILGQLHCGSLIPNGQITVCRKMKQLLGGLLNGEACLLIDGMEEAYLICVKGAETRSISEAQIEPVVRGPKDAFVESLKINIGLIRMRIPNANLSFKTIEIGKQTRTKVSIAYIRGICPPDRITEVYSRLKRINIDGILESGYLEEFIQDNPYSIFPQIRSTERPDVVSAALLEGRVAVLTDNTPIAMIAPGELFSLMQSSEDYYDRFAFSTLVRILRFLALIIAAFLPAFYIAVTNYHKEMIPTELLMSISQARIGVPISTVIEAFAMNFALELLYEAGIRLPRSLGQTISIVGALIIGQAAVQAKIVSPLMVIVISLTAIATFCIPQYSFTMPVRIIRLVFMILASSFGLFGMMIGILYVLLHLSSLRSFGVAYLAPLSPVDMDGAKDTLVRSPWWAMVKRPAYITQNRNRMRTGQKPRTPEPKA